MEALSSAREEDARRVYDQKCNEAAVAETNYTNAMQDVFGKAEALEEHVTTVTMRAAPRHGERLLPNDPRAAQRSPEPVERAVSTAACGWSRTKSRLTFESPNPRDLFSQRSFLSTNCHEYELPQMFDDDSESDQSSLSDPPVVEAKPPGSTVEFCSVGSDTDCAPAEDPSARVVRPRRSAVSSEGCETSRESSEGPKRERDCEAVVPNVKAWAVTVAPVSR